MCVCVYIYIYIYTYVYNIVLLALRCPQESQEVSWDCGLKQHPPGQRAAMGLPREPKTP